MTLDLHHLDADSAYHNWLERNGVLHSPEIERAFAASFNILSEFIAGPEQKEVDWSVVREAIVDTCDENGIGGPKDLEASFGSNGLLVIHRAEGVAVTKSTAVERLDARPPRGQAEPEPNDEV